MLELTHGLGHEQSFGFEILAFNAPPSTATTYAATRLGTVVELFSAQTAVYGGAASTVHRDDTARWRAVVTQRFFLHTPYQRISNEAEALGQNNALVECRLNGLGVEQRRHDCQIGISAADVGDRDNSGAGRGGDVNNGALCRCR